MRAYDLDTNTKVRIRRSTERQQLGKKADHA